MNKAVLAAGLMAFIAAALFVPYRVEYVDLDSESARVVLGLAPEPPRVTRMWGPVWSPHAVGRQESISVVRTEVATGALVAQMGAVLALVVALALIIPSEWKGEPNSRRGGSTRFTPRSASRPTSRKS